jgi:hypothetical protein
MLQNCHLPLPSFMLIISRRLIGGKSLSTDGDSNDVVPSYLRALIVFCPFQETFLRLQKIIQYINL